MIQSNFANKQSFDVYVEYNAIKRHFTTESYDYHKYNGKIKASFTSFKQRPDVYSFYKLSQKPHFRDILISNIVHNPKTWIKEISDESGHQIYLAWKRKIDSLSRIFEQEIKQLDENLSSNFIVESGNLPIVIERLLKKQISIETFAILANITNVFPYWDTELSNNIVTADCIMKARKYFPFLNVDTKKYTTILKQHIVVS